MNKTATRLGPYAFGSIGSIRLALEPLPRQSSSWKDPVGDFFKSLKRVLASNSRLTYIEIHLHLSDLLAIAIAKKATCPKVLARLPSPQKYSFALEKNYAYWFNGLRECSSVRRGWRKPILAGLNEIDL